MVLLPRGITSTRKLQLLKTRQKNPEVAVFHMEKKFFLVRLQLGLEKKGVREEKYVDDELSVIWEDQFKDPYFDP